MFFNLIMMDIENATVQEKFMLMLLERIDQLTDEIHQLKKDQAIRKLHEVPDTTECKKRLNCSDIGAIAIATFLRARVDNVEVAMRFINTLKHTYGVDAFVYDSRPTNEYSTNWSVLDEYDEIESIPHGAYTIQALVCLKHSMVVSGLGVELCNMLSANELSMIELGPIRDFVGGFKAINQDCGLFLFTYYYIVGAKHGVDPSYVTEREMEWILSDGSTFTHSFEHNIGLDTDFGKLCRALDKRNIGFGDINILPWYRKIKQK